MSPIFERITAIADVIIAVALVALVGVGVWCGVSLLRVRRALERALARLREDLHPVLALARTIGEDVHGIIDTVRSDVDAVSSTVDDANARVRRGIAETETRLGEFNALLDVVQHEAESLFLSTASSVRGFRGGVAAWGSARPRRGPEFASDELDAAEAADEPELVEEVDGQSNNSESNSESPAEERAAPRVRRRVPSLARRPRPRERD